MRKKQIGFFGGSFDPIHFGHIHIAIFLSELHSLDQVIFCPAYVSPFKKDRMSHASFHHREVMIKKAIETIPSFSFCGYELQKEQTSYTIDTVKYLLSQYTSQKQDVQLRLIVGDDMLADLTKWRCVDELLSLAPPIVGSRVLDPKWPEGLSDTSYALLQASISTIPILDISSTYLRKRLKHRQYCGHLIPSCVLEYIHQNKLYE
jgi:nicotinate-nucleotide adenylyltransferase